MEKKAMKEQLKKAWKEVFDLKEVENDADFFEAGGDSIKAVQLSTWLVQKGIKLDLSVIFSNPTLDAMADSLEETTPMYIPETFLNKEVAANEVYDKMMSGSMKIDKEQALSMLKTMPPVMASQIIEQYDKKQLLEMLKKVGISSNDLKGTAFESVSK